MCRSSTLRSLRLRVRALAHTTRSFDTREGELRRTRNRASTHATQSLHTHDSSCDTRVCERGPELRPARPRVSMCNAGGANVFCSAKWFLASQSFNKANRNSVCTCCFGAAVRVLDPRCTRLRASTRATQSSDTRDQELQRRRPRAPTHPTKCSTHLN